MPDGENGRVVILHCKELKSGMYNSGNDYISENAASYHYLKDIPFSKLEASDQVRKKPLYFGPYQVQKVVRGQSLTWVPNKYYWRSKPKLFITSFHQKLLHSQSRIINLILLG